MIGSVGELLDKLEEIYPNRLPSLRDYDEKALLVNIGHQEVISVIRRLIGKD